MPLGRQPRLPRTYLPYRNQLMRHTTNHYHMAGCIRRIVVGNRRAMCVFCNVHCTLPGGDMEWEREAWTEEKNVM